MGKCPDCDVWVDQDVCPLCHENIADHNNIFDEEKWYPDYDIKRQRIKSWISKLAIFLGSLVVFICLVINMIVIPHFLWVFYVAVAIFYVLVSLSHTILSASHIGGKITAQVVSLTILLLVVDVMSGNFQWSVDYVVPFLIITGIFLLSIIILIVPLKWTGYLSSLLIMIGMGFIPVLLYVSGLANVLWPSITAALFAVAVFSILLLFANHSFMTQLGRRFHL